MNEMKLPGFICIVAQVFYHCQESCSIVLESLKYPVAHLVFLSRREYHMLLRERCLSKARTERVDTFFRPAVRAGLPPLPAGSGIPEGRGRGGPRRAGPA